jgi:hypothetical protein
MRFDAAHPERLTRVRWYFTPEGAPALGLPTRFASRVWDIKEFPIVPLGETASPRPWRGPVAPFPVGVGGLCGTPDQWLNGVSDGDPVPPVHPGTMVPTCCGLPNLFTGGREITGSSQVESCCPAAGGPGALLVKFLGPEPFCNILPGQLFGVVRFDFECAGAPFDNMKYWSPEFDLNGGLARVFVGCSQDESNLHLQPSIRSGGCFFGWATWVRNVVEECNPIRIIAEVEINPLLPCPGGSRFIEVREV